jgi:hypothetical protein
MSDNAQGTPNNAVGRATVPGAGRPAGSAQRGGPSSVSSPANPPKPATTPSRSAAKAPTPATPPVVSGTGRAKVAPVDAPREPATESPSAENRPIATPPPAVTAAVAASVGAAASSRTAPIAPAGARAQVSDAVRSARDTVAAAAGRGPRRAKLQLKRIDPWSVMKFSAAASLVLFIVLVVATSVLYGVLQGMGVFDSVNGLVKQLTTDSNGATGLDLGITAGSVIGTAAILGAVNMFLFTALATLSAFVYNVCADLVGGIEVTLAERD